MNFIHLQYRDCQNIKFLKLGECMRPHFFVKAILLAASVYAKPQCHKSIFLRYSSFYIYPQNVQYTLGCERKLLLRLHYIVIKLTEKERERHRGY